MRPKAFGNALFQLKGIVERETMSAEAKAAILMAVNAVKAEVMNLESEADRLMAKESASGDELWAFVNKVSEWLS